MLRAAAPTSSVSGGGGAPQQVPTAPAATSPATAGQAYNKRLHATREPHRQAGAPRPAARKPLILAPFAAPSATVGRELKRVGSKGPAWTRPARAVGSAREAVGESMAADEALTGTAVALPVSAGPSRKQVMPASTAAATAVTASSQARRAAAPTLSHVTAVLEELAVTATASPRTARREAAAAAARSRAARRAPLGHGAVAVVAGAPSGTVATAAAAAGSGAGAPEGGGSTALPSVGQQVEAEPRSEGRVAATGTGVSASGYRPRQAGAHRGSRSVGGKAASKAGRGGGSRGSNWYDATCRALHCSMSLSLTREPLHRNATPWENPDHARPTSSGLGHTVSPVSTTAVQSVIGRDSVSSLHAFGMLVCEAAGSTIS